MRRFCLSNSSKHATWFGYSRTVIQRAAPIEAPFSSHFPIFLCSTVLILCTFCTPRPSALLRMAASSAGLSMLSSTRCNVARRCETTSIILLSRTSSVNGLSVSTTFDQTWSGAVSMLKCCTDGDGVRACGTGAWNPAAGLQAERSSSCLLHRWGASACPLADCCINSTNASDLGAISFASSDSLRSSSRLPCRARNRRPLLA
mmetsp:Transcript_77284/g.145718  ORF Transcript_77284/g.145718 Transcript_77284/m.145718 type:complete len:203 (-) Transcript_77284:96-704(-)